MLADFSILPKLEQLRRRDIVEGGKVQIVGIVLTSDHGDSPDADPSLSPLPEMRLLRDMRGPPLRERSQYEVT